MGPTAQDAANLGPDAKAEAERLGPSKADIENLVDESEDPRKGGS